MNEIFDKRNSFWSGNDMRGSFTHADTFEITRISGTMGSYGYRSKLVGEIITQSDKAEIKTIIRTSPLFYVWFFVSILSGIGGLVQYMQTYSPSVLIGAIVMLLIGPTLTIIISNFKTGTLTDRYKRYIDTQLRK